MHFLSKPGSVAAFLLAAAMIPGTVTSGLSAQDTKPGGSSPAPAAKAVWKNGPPTDPSFFPLAVWMQPPNRAKDYKAAGVNIYVNVWKGPTEKQLAQLREAGMPLICHMNDVGYKHRNDPMIIGWLQPDEPDILHANHGGWPELKSRTKWSTTVGQYQPPIHPDEIISRYKFLKAVDPTRPVFVSLSFAVIYPNYGARGHRKGHSEDFKEYMKGLDIVAFDIYPGVHQYKKAAAKYWTVAKGVVNLRKWAAGRLPVWVDIEAMVKRHDGATYLLTVRMENSPARGTFQVKGLPQKATAEVIGEKRTIEISSGKFTDDFEPLGVHLYRIPPAR